MTLRLIIGNKNYSSWSFRPWLAMKVAGLDFVEEVQPLDTPEFRERLSNVSGTGKVPTLLDDDISVWESLAIIEYLAERFPQAQLWPDEAAARAHARAISAEMHAGLQPLRRACPMNMRRTPKAIDLDDEVRANVARIEAMWSDCRARFAKSDGPFLFGRFSAADAMYAPVVARLRTYSIPVGPRTLDYMNAVETLPAYIEWVEAARIEPWTRAKDEIP